MTMLTPRDPGPLLCLGRVYCDLVFQGAEAMPRLGEERFARDVSFVPGGGAFITAAHAAALGVPSALVARLGEDALAQAIAPAMQQAGIDLTYLKRAEDAGPQLTVVIVQDGERAFLSRRAGGAAPATLPSSLASGARHLHVAEFATLAEISGLMSEAKRAGLTLSLDPSWDDALIHAPDLLERCSGVDVFMPNAAEARTISRCDDLDAAGRALARHMPVVVIKNGPDGALLFRDDLRIALPAPLGAKVVDTTGAGDAFNAGFLAAWLSNQDAVRALAQGVACGALSVGSVGGAGVRPDPRQVARMADAVLAQGART